MHIHTHTHLNRHSSYMQLKCNTHTQIGTCMYILTYDYILIILKMWCRSPNNKKEAPTTSHNKYFICMHIRTNVHTHMPSHTKTHTHTQIYNKILTRKANTLIPRLRPLHMYTDIHMYVFSTIYIYTCIYLYIYMHTYIYNFS